MGVSNQNELLSDLEDKKLGILEMVGLAGNLTDFVKIAKDWAALVEELKELTESEQIDIANLVAMNVPNGQNVAKWVQWILNLFDAICIMFGLIVDAKELAK